MRITQAELEKRIRAMAGRMGRNPQRSATTGLQRRNPISLDDIDPRDLGMLSPRRRIPEAELDDIDLRELIAPRKRTPEAEPDIDPLALGSQAPGKRTPDEPDIEPGALGLIAPGKRTPDESDRGQQNRWLRGMINDIDGSSRLGELRGIGSEGELGHDPEGPPPGSVDAMMGEAIGKDAAMSMGKRGMLGALTSSALGLSPFPGFIAATLNPYSVAKDVYAMIKKAKEHSRVQNFISQEQEEDDPFNVVRDLTYGEMDTDLDSIQADFDAINAEISESEAEGAMGPSSSADPGVSGADIGIGLPGSYGGGSVGGDDGMGGYGGYGGLGIGNPGSYGGSGDSSGSSGGNVGPGAPSGDDGDDGGGGGDGK